VQVLVLGAIATAIGIAVALSIHWFPTNAAKQDHPIDTLYKVLLVVSVPIFVLVETIVLFSVWKFRMRPGQELDDGPPLHGNTRLEVVWTAFPAILLVSLCTYAYAVLRDVEKVHANEVRVEVTGQQFEWSFCYPQSGGRKVCSPQLYLPEDKPVRFDIHALDVLHGFWIPAFRLKLDAVPGTTTHLRITPTRLGDYPVVCTQLCGLGHSVMRSTAHVVTAAAFTRWLQGKANPATPSAAAGASSSTVADAGKTLFTGSGGCGACHTLADAGTTGTVGPNLGTQVAGDAKKAKMSLTAFIRESIIKPDAFIAHGFPPHTMPGNFGQTLSKSQIDALVAYLAKVTK
jgi:cytochrome c oxidase subunit 2